MINRQRKGAWPPKYRISPEMKMAYEEKLEQEYPGYLWESQKQKTMVWTLTGVRALYAVYYLILARIIGLELIAQVFILIQLVLFYFWAALMIRSGSFVAVLLLAVRGLDIIRTGPALLALSPFTDFLWIFTLVLALMIEFIEAVFCIYLLFNRQAAQTIKLNRRMDQELPVMQGSVSRETVETMAGYQNPFSENGGRNEEKQPRPEKQEELKRQAEPESQAELKRQAEPESQEESKRQAEPESQEESKRQAQEERQAEPQEQVLGEK